MNSFSPDYFIHVANVLLLVAYSVRDILWLRMFAVAASLMSLPYFLLQPTVLWAPLAWTIGFAGINLFQSWRLYLERQPIKLTAEEEEVRQLAFRDVPPRKVLQVLSIGTWSTEQSGERLIESGKVPDDLALIVRGNVRVTKGGSDIGVLGPGDFVGSSLILSGLPADFDAVVEDPVRAVHWQIGTLEKYLNANPEMRIVMQRHLARDLSGKVGQLVKGAVKPRGGAE
jgi:Cyclic nucleotide-binding domain